ncbi:fumarate hydratase [Mucilaginibacter calamicampi]|uniref:Fumarate hydratase n=1 Tax=Mucilaginibacter calamicampi TaxID=1302352 RepID=A0ABW2Z1S1_9SPHI
MQKAFTFLLLALTLASCSLNPSFQGKGEASLQGEWKQDTIAMQNQLLNYSLYEFKFSCDSVYGTIRSFSKVNNGYDTCMNAGKWAEYFRGTYEQKNDTMRIKGNFCNADFSLKGPEGCFRSGVYQDVFKVSRQGDSLVQLSSTSNVIPLNLRLTHKLVCNPKPL